MSIKAMKLAVKTLEDSCTPLLSKKHCIAYDETIDSLRAAIEKAEDEAREFQYDYKAGLLEWLAKTEWVQNTAKPHELGKHRADIIKERMEALTQSEHEGWRHADELEQERKQLVWVIELLYLATKDISIGHYNEEVLDIALSKASKILKDTSK